MTDELTTLTSAAAYCGERSNVFPSRGSLDWFIRNNRRELVEAGALLFIAGQWHIRPARFDQCVLSIGARLAHRGEPAGGAA